MKNKVTISRQGPKLVVKNGTFAELLEAYKVETGRNYAWVGEHLGLSQGGIYHLRTGKPPGQATLWLMADLLGIVVWDPGGRVDLRG